MNASILSRVGLWLGALGALGASAAAQATCIGPDNLQGPCCTPTLANLPAFPATSLPGIGICWGQCTPVNQPIVKVIMSPPVAVNCGRFQAQLSITNSVGNSVLGGVIDLDYTRTWFEVAPVAPGGQYQVWRFLVKGDLGAPASASGICPTPPCIGPYPGAFFYGYVDYALDCITNTWSNAFVMYHGCDRFMHRPGLSFTPGVFHPGGSTAIVAPVTAANPFVSAPNPFPSGPLMAEGMRNQSPLGALACVTEEPISFGIQQFLGQGCACPLLPGPGMHSANLFQGQGTCPDTSGVPSFFQALNIPGQPWLWNVKTSIGMWTNPAGGYPGNEVVWLDEGVYQYHDTCSPGFGVTTDWIEVNYGASTAKGFNVLPSDPGTILSDKFIDIASNYSTLATAPAPMPAVGMTLPTRHLIYANVP